MFTGLVSGKFYSTLIGFLISVGCFDRNCKTPKRCQTRILTKLLSLLNMLLHNAQKLLSKHNISVNLPNWQINITRPSFSIFFFLSQYHSVSSRLNRFPKQITQTRQYPEWHCFPVVWLLFQLFNFGPNRHFLSLFRITVSRLKLTRSFTFAVSLPKVFMIFFSAMIGKKRIENV